MRLTPLRLSTTMVGGVGVGTRVGASASIEGAGEAARDVAREVAAEATERTAKRDMAVASADVGNVGKVVGKR